MLEKVKATIEKYDMLQKGDRVLVGVSGGPDSVALLHILWKLRDLYSLFLHVVHLNHMFRGKEAEEDAEYVRMLCKEMEVPVVIETFDVPAFIEETGLSPEDAARKVRYGVYERVAGMLGARKIALGHNADDQAETVIMRVLRGTGLKGLGGIPPVRDGRFIRPLIEVTRTEIEAYCREEGLQTRMDATNVEPIYFRNKVRLELLPLLEERYSPAIKKHLHVLADIAREDDLYLDGVAKRVFKELASEEGKGAISLPLKGLLALPLSMQRRVVKLTVRAFFEADDPLSFLRIEEVLQMARTGRTGDSLDLPRGLRARKGYDNIVIERRADVSDTYFKGEVTVAIPGETSLPELGIAFHAEVFGREILKEKSLLHEPSAPYALLDLEGLEKPLVIRTRREGDVFQPLGMKGRKKLKDFFIDQKIPRRMRSGIPLLTTGNEVLWVVGVRISERVRITEKTKEVTFLEVYNIVI